MKKLLTIFLGLVLLLSMLNGCQKGGEDLETTGMTTETTAATVATVATEVTTVPTEATETTDAIEEVTAEPVANDTVFKDGTWIAQCGPTSRYYFFEEEGTAGRFANMEDGKGTQFTYQQTGDQGVLSLNGGSVGASCKVVVQDENHVTLEWANQPVETMTYVSPLGAEQFHFYTNEELAWMAWNDYRAKNDPSDESLMAAAMDNGDGTSTIQIYQNLGDHNSTAAYYVVDRCTGEGQNISDGTYVDLTNGTQDMDIFYGHPESVLPEGVPYLILSETEYTQLIVLRPLVTVTDFCVVSIEMVETKDDFAFRVVGELFDAASMGPETGMLLAMELPENIPNVGVIYKDRYGAEKFYAVMYSGLDGSALLIEQNLV